MAAAILTPAGVVETPIPPDPAYASPVVWTSRRESEPTTYVTAGLTVATQPYGRKADMEVN